MVLSNTAQGISILPNTTANITGGTIDNTVIGGTTSSTGTFTTLTASNVNFGTALTTAIGGSVGAICTAPFSTTSTALSAVSGLSVSTVSSATYVFEAYLQGTANAAAGLKVGMGQGTATVSSFASDSWMYNGTTVSGQTQSASYAGPQIASTAAFTTATITGTVVTNAAGTFTIQAAQNAANATSTTILKNSYLLLTRIA